MTMMTFGPVKMKRLLIVFLILLSCDARLVSGFVAPRPLSVGARQQSWSRLEYKDERQMTQDTEMAIAQADTKSKNAKSIMGRAGNNLVGSNLIYVLAQLRMYSYCGYTVTPFQELKVPMTSFKLLQVILEELAALVKRQSEGTEEEKREEYPKNLRLLQILDFILSYDPQDLDVIASSKRSDDGARLIGTVDNLKGDLDGLATSLGQTTDKDARLVVDEKDKIAADRAADMMAQRDPNEAQWISEQADEENLVDTLLDGLSEASLQEDSFFSKIFADDIELFFFDDQYESKKCVYGIAVNRSQRKVTVIFRGSSNIYDWSSNLKVLQESVDNPVIPVVGSEAAASQPKKVAIHKGFYNYLRRDFLDQGESRTHHNRFEYIFQIAKSYLENDSWRLCVTGHSLGGALATLFGFYAATEDSEMLNGQPVEVYSFASPLVGDEDFRKAFKCLEENKKLMHARFCNEGDWVPLIPFVAPPDDSWWKLNKYKGYEHVGLQIQLPKKGSNKPADVFYNMDDDLFSKLRRSAYNLKRTISNVPNLVPKRAALLHGLTEYEKRMSEIATNAEIDDSELEVSIDEYYKKHIWTQQ